MIIARQKRKENITEYVLYMWQIEDLMRACKFDMQVINDNIISRFEVDAATREEVVEWYERIVNEMQTHGLERSGHIDEIYGILNDLNHLHLTLINVLQNEEYKGLHEAASESIRDVQRKSGRPKNDVETCLNGLYGVLLLRLQNREISKETLEAVQHFNGLLGKLAFWYNEMSAGRLKLPKEKQN